jgi:hypothetical protein
VCIFNERHVVCDAVRCVGKHQKQSSGFVVTKASRGAHSPSSIFWTLLPWHHSLTCILLCHKGVRVLTQTLLTLSQKRRHSPGNPQSQVSSPHGYYIPTQLLQNTAAHREIVDSIRRKCNLFKDINKKINTLLTSPKVSTSNNLEISEIQLRIYLKIILLFIFST